MRANQEKAHRYENQNQEKLEMSEEKQSKGGENKAILSLGGYGWWNWNLWGASINVR